MFLTIEVSHEEDYSELGEFSDAKTEPNGRREYAVMLALIIVVCIIAITALGSNANVTFTNVSNTIANSSGGGGGGGLVPQQCEG